MFVIKCYLLCLAGFFFTKAHAGLVSFIKPCKANDNECILSSAQAAIPQLAAGIPELGVPIADPMELGSTISNYPNLKLGFRNGQLSGASKCKVKTVSRNTEKNTVKIVVQCPLLAEGQYELDGKVLLLNVFGKGDYKIQTDKIEFSIEINIEDIEKDGHKYWKVTDFNYKFKLLDKVHINLENLFDGDEEQAKPFRDLLEVSWKEIIENLGDPVMKHVISKYMDVVKKFLLSVPADQLELA